jgi:hypothetical protein
MTILAMGWWVVAADAVGLPGYMTRALRSEVGPGRLAVRAKTGGAFTHQSAELSVEL